MNSRALVLSILGSLLVTLSPAIAAEIPEPGTKAPDFSLKSLDGDSVRLSELQSAGNVVVVVLRGWPGYQCPICDLQVQEFIGAAKDFAEANAQIVFVYPGPAEGLVEHAEEFANLDDKQWPKGCLFVLDPDYSMVNAYGLRWDAPQETAYPSTFLLDETGTVRWAKTSREHGDRSSASDVLAQIESL